MKKADIILKIKQALEWDESIDSDWLYEMKEDELTKLLKYTQNWVHPNEIEADTNLQGMIVWSATNEKHEYWSKIYERIRA